MSKEPKKMDRRKFIYAGLGAAVIVVGGVAVYLGTRPATTITSTTTAAPTTVTSTTTAAPTTVTSTTTATTTATATSTSTNEMVFWRTTMLTPPGETAWTTLISDFQNAHPEVPLKVESIGESDLPTKAGATFQLGAIPFDLSWTTVPENTTVWGAEGWIDDLKPVFDWIDSQYPGDLISAAKFTSPGPGGTKAHFQLNAGEVSFLMNSRIDWIKAAGLDPADVSGAFDKFNTMLYALKPTLPTGVNPFDIQIGTSSPGDGQIAIWNLIDVFQGKPVVSADATVSLDHSAVAQAFSTIYKWWTDGILPKGMVTETDFDNNDLFQTEKVAITPNSLSVWKWVSINKPDWVTPPGNKMMLSPWPPLSAVNGQSFPLTSNRAFVMSKNIPDAKKEMVFKFLEFFYTKENYDKFWANAMGDYMDAPIYNHLLNAPPYTTDYYQTAVATAIKNGFPQCEGVRPSFGALMTDYVAGQAYLRLATGTMTAQEAADWYISQVVSYVQTYDGETITL